MKNRLLPTALLCAACASSDRVQSFDGLELAIDDRGSGEPALVFVHGWCCDRTQWAPQLDAFAGEHRVVAIDLGGHGESGQGREAWSMMDYPRDVQAVCEALGLERVVLVGHSMGGPVCLLAAASMPERVAGVIGVDSVHTVQIDYTEELIGPWVDDLEADLELALKDFVEGAFPAGADPAVVERVLEVALRASPELAVGLMRSFIGYLPRETLAGCPAPVVCVNTPLMMATDVEGNRRSDPDFAAIVLEGLGHWPMLEDPVGFNAALRSALTMIEGPVRGVSPILSVEAIEPCLPLWDRLGFERVAEVPGEGGLAFAMLQKGEVVVMYQSYASLEEDVPDVLADVRAGRGFLYVTVDDLKAVRDAIGDLEVVVPERTTFYGKREVCVRDAAGNYLLFAADV